MSENAVITFRESLKFGYSGLRWIALFKGCSMGGKLSPSLANIYCNMLETTIIDPEFENGNIKQYFRYVDDIVCLVKTKYKNKLSENSRQHPGKLHRHKQLSNNT